MFLQEKCWRVLLTTLFCLIFSVAQVVSIQEEIPHFLGDIKLNSEIRGGNGINIILLLVELNSLLKIVEYQDVNESDKQDDSSLFANLVVGSFLFCRWLLTGELHEELGSRSVAILELIFGRIGEVVLVPLAFFLIVNGQRAVTIALAFGLEIGTNFVQINAVGALLVLKLISVGIINSAWRQVSTSFGVDSDSCLVVYNFGDRAKFA